MNLLLHTCCAPCAVYPIDILKEKGGFVLLSAIFDLSTNQEKYSSLVDNIYFRKHKQPEWNTCWSFFKNPSRDISAWKLIEEVWLKWYNNWSAYFSDLHSNFLMNNSWGSFKDLLSLIKLAQEKVKEKYDINLIPEVRIIK